MEKYSKEIGCSLFIIIFFLFFGFILITSPSEEEKNKQRKIRQENWQRQRDVEAYKNLIIYEEDEVSNDSSKVISWSIETKGSINPIRDLATKKVNNLLENKYKIIDVSFYSAGAYHFGFKYGAVILYQAE